MWVTIFLLHEGRIISKREPISPLHLQRKVTFGTKIDVVYNFRGSFPFLNPQLKPVKLWNRLILIYSLIYRCVSRNLITELHKLKP